MTPVTSFDLIEHLEFVITCDGDDRVIHDGAILIEGDRIKDLGATAEVNERMRRGAQGPTREEVGWSAPGTDARIRGFPRPSLRDPVEGGVSGCDRHPNLGVSLG